MSAQFASRPGRPERPIRDPRTRQAAPWAPALRFATAGTTRPLGSQQPGAAGPLVLRAEHLDRDLGRVGIGRNAVLVEVLGRLLDLHVAGKRGDDGLHLALLTHLLD